MIVDIVYFQSVRFFQGISLGEENPINWNISIFMN